MRQMIRDRRSPGKIQTRVMDFIIEDDGCEILETKDGNVRKRILFQDFEEQITEARRKKREQEQNFIDT